MWIKNELIGTQSFFIKHFDQMLKSRNQFFIQLLFTRQDLVLLEQKEQI